MHEQNEALGVLLKVTSVVAFAVMSGLIKYLDGTIPLGELVFFRSSIALIPLTLFLMWQSDFPKGLKTQHPWQHIIRCILGTFAMFSAFKVLELLPIAEATALNYLNPIFLVVLSMLILKEKVTTRRWLGVGCGVFGLVLMTLPKLTAFTETTHSSLFGVGLGLLTALLIAAAMLQVKQLTQMGENVGAITFYFAITSTVIGAFIMLHDMTMPTAWQWACLLAIGFIGGLAQITMTLAFKFSDASALAPFDYLAIVFSVIIGFVIFDEIPDVIFWFAMPLILAGAIIAKPNSSRTITSQSNNK